MRRSAGIGQCITGLHQAHTAFAGVPGYPVASVCAFSSNWCGNRHECWLGSAIQQVHSIRVGRDRGGAQGEDRCGDENNLFHAILTPQNRLGSLAGRFMHGSAPDS